MSQLQETDCLPWGSGRGFLLTQPSHQQAPLSCAWQAVSVTFTQADDTALPEALQLFGSSACALFVHGLLAVLAAHQVGPGLSPHTPFPGTMSSSVWASQCPCWSPASYSLPLYLNPNPLSPKALWLPFCPGAGTRLGLPPSIAAMDDTLSNVLTESSLCPLGIVSQRFLMSALCIGGGPGARREN